MYILIKTSTKATPHIYLDPNKGVIELKGMSIMEDPLSFYSPMIGWLNEYMRNPRDTEVNIDLQYFNGNSAKVLLIFIKALSRIQDYGYKLEVKWFYDQDDEEVKNSGHTFSTMTKVNFHLVEKYRNEN
jgi:hypothetical protein